VRCVPVREPLPVPAHADGAEGSRTS
jgi:hypothetical protein